MKYIVELVWAQSPMFSGMYTQNYVSEYQASGNRVMRGLSVPSLTVDIRKMLETLITNL